MATKATAGHVCIVAARHGKGGLEDYIRTARIVVQGPLHRGGGHPDKQLAVLAPSVR